MQYPRRRETDEQAKERVEKIEMHNKKYSCDSQGRPINADGEVLKNLNKKELEIFKGS